MAVRQHLEFDGQKYNGSVEMGEYIISADTCERCVSMYGCVHKWQSLWRISHSIK